MVENEYTKELVAFMHETGFVWGPSPEIYGGLAGFYTYGPLGKLLKNNVENAIRKTFIENQFWEVECPIIMPEKVWEASGHLGSFSDPLIKCTKCDSEFRVSLLIEEAKPELEIGGIPNEALLKIIEEHNIICPKCKGRLGSEITEHNLMMSTKVGTNTVVYNRPETATTTYLPFPRFNDFFRKKYPFGVFQIGKAFRNEISPRQHMLRMREFTQAEGQLFLYSHQKYEFERFNEAANEKLPLWSHALQKEKKPVQLVTLHDAVENGMLKNQAYAWTLHLAYRLFKGMGIPAEKIRFRQHSSDELAFYAEDAWDVEIQLGSFGWTEVCGVHDRKDYDLKQHGKFSGQKLEVFDEGTKEKLVPHVLEIAFGSDRPVYALLDIFYDPSDSERKVLRVPYYLSPIKVAVLPLVNKEKLPELAQKICNDLKEFVCIYDKAGSIGRRYSRNDIRGTAFCVTVDFDSIKNEDVTLRDRDSHDQVRIKIKDLKETIRKLIDRDIKFKDLK
ncbi:glycine--tRNA ligase [Candidatus Woesearchaeota archaeon]|nr:glycine--tRNA ligase [Candidatus Woesearchaeota archaeon]